MSCSQVELPWIFEHMPKELMALAPTMIEIKEDRPDGNIIIGGAERVRCVKVLVQPSSTVKKPADSTTLLSQHPMSCCHVARPFSKELWSAW